MDGNRQNLFKEQRKYNLLFFDDRELEVGANGDDAMENGAEISARVEDRDEVVEGYPGFVLVSDDGGENFPVQFDEHVVLGAEDDGFDQRAPDGIFLVGAELEFFVLGLPLGFDIVLQLDQGSLLDGNAQRVVIYYLHEGSAVSFDFGQLRQLLVAFLQ